MAVLLQLLSSVGRCLFCPRIRYSRKRPRKDRLIPPGPSSERYSLRGPEGRAGLQPPPKALRMNVRPRLYWSGSAWVRKFPKQARPLP